MEKIITALANVLVALDWDVAPEEVREGYIGGSRDGRNIQIRVATYGIAVSYKVSDFWVRVEHDDHAETLVEVNWPSVGARPPAEAAAFGLALCTASARAARAGEAFKAVGAYDAADVQAACAWLGQNAVEFVARVAAARAAVAS